MDIESELAGRINMPDINRIAAWVREKPENRNSIWLIVKKDDKVTSANALWVLTHLISIESEWLASLQNELTDMLIKETVASKKRMLLKLLREQDYSPETMRADLLDYCLSKINSECEPYAIRAFSIYLAFKMCVFFPELTAELKEHLSMMQLQSLSPGLRCARNKTLSKIKRIERHANTGC